METSNPTFSALNLSTSKQGRIAYDHRRYTTAIYYSTYEDAYADIAAAERARVLSQSVTDDVVFTNPTGEGQGLGNLIKHIEQFQKQRLGAYFKSNKLLTHHGQLLSGWTMYNKDGSEFTTAHTYARVNEQGLTHLAGFWKV